MTVFAIVPVKELTLSKRRLSSKLSPEKRGELTAAMLKDVLSALKSSKLHDILVVSPDIALREVAEKLGFFCLCPKQTGLNPGLKEAIEWCLQKKADSVLILPADIPLVSCGDVDKLIELGAKKPVVVLSPSLNGGTNALFLNPPDVIRVSFGKGSFYTHVKEAIDKEVPVRFHASKEIMMDIDSNDDLSKLLDVKGIAAKQVFKQLKKIGN
jgi:2-phospho-L-lactate guanylyltransferase